MPGNFVDEEGNVMGQHRGLIHYTIGQRKGLGISSTTPIFVKELRSETNEVVLCKSESLFSHDCHVDNINYMAEEKLTEPVRAIGKSVIPMREQRVRCIRSWTVPCWHSLTNRSVP